MNASPLLVALIKCAEAGSRDSLRWSGHPHGVNKRWGFLFQVLQAKRNQYSLSLARRSGRERTGHPPHLCPISVSTKGLGQDWVSTGPSWFPCFSLHYTKLPIRNACLRTEWHTFPACCLTGSQRNKRKPAMKRKMRQSEQQKRKGKEQSQYPVGPRGGDGRSQSAVPAGSGFKDDFMLCMGMRDRRKQEDSFSLVRYSRVDS